MTISMPDLKAAEAVARVAAVAVPALLSFIVDLFKKGHSEEEVLKIVNIESRREAYEQDKAADRRRLDDKHADADPDDAG